MAVDNAQADIQPLRQTDFLPKRYSGEKTDHEECSAHYLSFTDYLQAHNLEAPADNAALVNVINLFKRSLQGQARLWIEGKTFDTLPILRTQFINRFSKNKSVYAHIRDYDSITYEPGDSAERHMSKIKLAAQRIDYGDAQIKNKFIATLTPKCRAAVAMSVPADAGLEAIVTSAQNYIDLSSEDKPHDVTFSINEPTVESLRHEINSLKVDLANEKRNTDRQSRQRQRITRNTPRSPSPSPYRPRQLQPQRNTYGRQQRQFTCNYCGIPGHMWRECRKRASQSQQPPPFPQSYFYPPNPHQNPRQHFYNGD